MRQIPATNLGQLQVGICVVTFKRPELLRKLLAGLARLKFDKMPAPEIHVVVIDNDAAGSAQKICKPAELPWALQYAIEPCRGIARARNRAIQEAAGRDFLAFLDDDEVPAAQWLEELLWTQAQFDADVVCGPVLPRFAGDTPEWVKRGRFFERMYIHGQPLNTCGSGNVLIRERVFATVPGFDERFALTGGEDTHFFLRLHRAGYSIRSSDRAIVYETISASRSTVRGILRRAYQSGNSWVLCETSLDRSISTRILRIAKGLGRIVQGGAAACFSILAGKLALVKALRKICLGAGMLTAVAGWSCRPYQSAGSDMAS
jgi:succinoglycan biosynthesis protein ExoM